MIVASENERINFPHLCATWGENLTVAKRKLRSFDCARPSSKVINRETLRGATQKVKPISKRTCLPSLIIYQLLDRRDYEPSVRHNDRGNIRWRRRKPRWRKVWISPESKNNEQEFLMLDLIFIFFLGWKTLFWWLNCSARDKEIALKLVKRIAQIDEIIVKKWLMWASEVHTKANINSFA